GKGDGGSGGNETEDGSVQLIITRSVAPYGVDANIPLSASTILIGRASAGVPAPDMLLELQIESPKNSGTYKSVGTSKFFPSVTLNVDQTYIDDINPQDIQVLGGLISDSYGTQKFKGKMTLTNIFSPSGVILYTSVVSVVLGEPPSGSIGFPTVT
ncbi:MAG: hypothetical protein Q7R49_05825, partial [Candidatus Daviesbacteria bacterium]|nr:hypothetical protein [Candidatus Daviesbacteria bacterium]